jgi:hypothetical protein
MLEFISGEKIIIAGTGTIMFGETGLLVLGMAVSLSFNSFGSGSGSDRRTTKQNN